jgi:hypothetical protein
MPDPLLLALKHQACRPEVAAARGASRASASLPYIRRRMDLAAGQRRRLFPDQRALQLAHPGPDCRVVRALPQMKVSRGRNERQVIGRKEALEHFPTRPACAGNRRDVVADLGSRIKFELGQAEFGASDGCRQCFLCRSDDCVLLAERGHRPRQAQGQKHDPEGESDEHAFGKESERIVDLRVGRREQDQENSVRT